MQKLVCVNYLYLFPSFSKHLKYAKVIQKKQQEGKRSLGGTVEDKAKGNGKSIRVTVFNEVCVNEWMYVCKTNKCSNSTELTRSHKLSLKTQIYFYPTTALTSVFSRHIFIGELHVVMFFVWGSSYGLLYVVVAMCVFSEMYLKISICWRKCWLIGVSEYVNCSPRTQFQ